MNRVFVYWDNSNIFHEAQRFAEERNEGPDARYRVHVHFDNILRLAHADRPLERAVAVGSCNQRMRPWAEENGTFIALDDFYDSITFMEPSRPGFEIAFARDAAEIDLSRRPTAAPGT